MGPETKASMRKTKPVFPLKQKRTDPNRPDPTKNGNENSAATNN